MRHRTMMISGVPAVRVYLSYEEAQDFLALDEERLGVLEALAESAGTAKARVRLDLYPIDQIAESAIEGEEECDEDYVEALYSLEGIDRPGLLKTPRPCCADRRAGDPGRGTRRKLGSSWGSSWPWTT